MTYSQNSRLDTKKPKNFEGKRRIFKTIRDKKEYEMKIADRDLRIAKSQIKAQGFNWEDLLTNKGPVKKSKLKHYKTNAEGGEGGGSEDST